MIERLKKLLAGSSGLTGLRAKKAGRFSLLALVNWIAGTSSNFAQPAAGVFFDDRETCPIYLGMVHDSLFLEGDELWHTNFSCRLTNPVFVPDMNDAVLFDAICERHFGGSGAPERQRVFLMSRPDDGLIVVFGDWGYSWSLDRCDPSRY